MLAIDVIDYRQLRRFYKLIREQSDHPSPPGWSRYTFTDLACLLVAIDICGPSEALQPGKRLVIAKLDAVCQYLVDQGIRNPLLTLSLKRRGRSIVVDLGGQIIDPRSGQLIMEEVADRADAFFHRSLLIDPDLADALTSEVARFRNR